jgi:predicted glycoside hydrolase/deacetylase ChbG (UPF0249 family)
VTRTLIVNADDFGLSEGVNLGIVEAHDHGPVLSASLLVRAPAARQAVSLARSRPCLDLGLHVDLGEWVYQQGEWRPAYLVVAGNDPMDIREEVWRQVALFQDLTGAGPTHLDSHQHVHRSEPARSALREASEALGVPLRHYTPGVRYCGDFYGQTGAGEPRPEAITVQALVDLIAGLPTGVTELACHPGRGTDFKSVYADERAIEVETLCDARVRAALRAENIRLSSFTERPGLGARLAAA